MGFMDTTWNSWRNWGHITPLVRTLRRQMASDHHHLRANLAFTDMVELSPSVINVVVSAGNGTLKLQRHYGFYQTRTSSGAIAALLPNQMLRNHQNQSWDVMYCPLWVHFSWLRQHHRQAQRCPPWWNLIFQGNPKLRCLQDYHI